MKLLVTVHQTQVCDLISSISFVDNILGIYLMFKGDCFPNGSYINEMYITSTSKLQCLLPYSTLSGGQWIDPHGQSVNCDINKIMYFSNVTQLIIQLISVYTEVVMVFMKLMEMIITIHSSVVYLVVVLILLPTSSLLIYSVSYISYCTSTHCHLLLIYFRTCSNLKLQCC